MTAASDLHPEPARGDAKEFTWQVRVYYEDTDSAGLVYHSNYLKFMERARTEWLRRRGQSQSQLQETEGVIFVVRRSNIRFFKPARMDELLAVRARITGGGGASLTFAQSISNEAGDLLCEAEIDIACLDARTFRPRRIPASMRPEPDHDA